MRVCSQWDPRWYQIGTLSLLLVYGIFWLRFDITWLQVLFNLATVLTLQYFCTLLFKWPHFEWRSAAISGLSLCLLLRTNLFWLIALAGVATILSKFSLRWQGKHVFNPTNFGIVLLLLLTDQIWVSPGQWGNIAFFGFLMVCIGGLVVNRARRSDVTLAFILFYLAILFGRSLWLGEPMAIPFHRLQSGAFLLFSFFMISDPKTTPDSRWGRILFALLVALGTGYVQFKLHRTNGLLWSLAFFSMFVPLINWLLPDNRYQWRGVTYEAKDGLVGSPA